MGGNKHYVVRLTGEQRAQLGKREFINREWLKMFPDPNDRPARHILNVSPHRTHWRFAAQFTAILRDPSALAEEGGNLVFSPILIGRSLKARHCFSRSRLGSS